MEDIVLDENSQQCWEEEINKKKRKGLWWKIPLISLLVLAVLTVAGGWIVWYQNVFTMDLTVQGETEITLEYGTEFTDPGALASFWGTLLCRDALDVPVTVSGSVDTAVLGTYELQYTAEKVLDLYVKQFTYTQTGSRTVHVVDTQAPTIQLVSVEGSYTLPGAVYVEEGYTAIDGYDGDLTAQVERVEADGVVTYTVSDASGNVSQVQRSIFYHDPTPPVLTLTGEADVSIYQGCPYNEPGYTAIDNCDGDMNSKVTVTGAVDSNKQGTYTLEYSVTDSYGNVVTATRIVRVIPQPVVPQLPTFEPQPPAPPNGKVIYLTFDDGPGPHTERLLNILDKYGVKATFFVVNTGYMHLLPRMVQSGHTVAMHSASHRYNEIYANDAAYFTDLQKIQNVILSYIGITPTLVRFPGGSSNTVSREYCWGLMTRLTARLDEMGYRYFDWNVDSRDVAGAGSAGAVYQNVVNGISKRNVSVVLQHDIKGFSVDAVESIIQWGQMNGYTFQALGPGSPECEHSLNN